MSFIASPSLAVQRPFVSSADDLADSLQGFRDSVLQLEHSNAEFSQANRVLKERIEQGKGQLQSLSSTREALEKEAKLYAPKPAKKSPGAQLKRDRIAEIQAQLPKIEGEKYAAQESLQNLMVRYEELRQELAVVEEPQGVSRLQEQIAEAQAAAAKEKIAARYELDEALRKVAVLDEEVAYQSLLRQDPEASLPSLNLQKEALRQKLGASAAAEPVIAAEDFKKVRLEIDELADRKKELAGLLQILDTQYDENEMSARNISQDNKLQQNLAALKQDNRVLRQQLAEMRLDMVNLDKKKAMLESAVQSVQ